MVRIEAPKQDRLQHAEHPRRQVGTPHTARAIVVLAAHHWVAQGAFRRVIVHRHFRTPQKDREPLPVVMQTAQDFVLGQVAGGLLQLCLIARLYLAQLCF